MTGSNFISFRSKKPVLLQCMEVFENLPFYLQEKIYEYHVINWLEANKDKFHKDHQQQFRFVMHQWVLVVGMCTNLLPNWMSEMERITKMLQNFFKENTKFKCKTKCTNDPTYKGKSSHRLRQLDGICVRKGCYGCHYLPVTKAKKKTKSKRNHTKHSYDDVISFIQEGMPFD
jgi:hypothetical protein